MKSLSILGGIYTAGHVVKSETFWRRSFVYIDSNMRVTEGTVINTIDSVNREDDAIGIRVCTGSNEFKNDTVREIIVDASCKALNHCDVLGLDREKEQVLYEVKMIHDALKEATTYFELSEVLRYCQQDIMEKQ